MSFIDVVFQFLFGLEGTPRNTVSEARDYQVFIEGVEFLAVIVMLTGNLGPGLVQLPHNLIFQCRDLPRSARRVCTYNAETPKVVVIL